MLRIRHFRFAISVALVLAITVCAGFMPGFTAALTTDAAAEAQETVYLKTFIHYSEDNNKIAADYAFEQLKSQFPNVEIVIDVMPNDNDEKIKTMAATGDLPDIIDINASLINLFKKSDLLLPLESYVEESGIASEFLPSAQEMFYRADGHIYALPNGVKEIICLFYNKELFEQNGVKVPENYEEFKDAVIAFKSKNIIPLALFAQQQWPGFSFYDALVAGQEPGGVRRVDIGAGEFTEPAYLEAAKKLVELVDLGLISKSAFNMGYDEAIATFMEGRAAMFQNGMWDAKNIGDEMGDKIGVLYPVALADPADVDSSKWNVVGGGFGNGFAVSSATKEKDIAANYAIHLSQKIIEGYVVKRSSIDSMLSGDFATEQPYNSLQQQLADDFKNFNAGTCFFWGLTDAKFSTAIGENVAKLLTGEYSPETFVSDMDKVVQEIRG